MFNCVNQKLSVVDAMLGAEPLFVDIDAVLLMLRADGADGVDMAVISYGLCLQCADGDGAVVAVSLSL